MSILHPHLLANAFAVVIACALCVRVQRLQKRPFVSGLLMGLASVFCILFHETKTLSPFADLGELAFLHISLWNLPVLAAALFCSPAASITAGVITCLSGVMLHLHQSAPEIAETVLFVYGPPVAASFGYIIRRLVFPDVRKCGFITCGLLACTGQLLIYFSLVSVLSVDEVMDRILEGFLPELLFSILSLAIAHIAAFGWHPISERAYRTSAGVMAAGLGIVTILGFCLPFVALRNLTEAMDDNMETLMNTPGSGVFRWLDTTERALVTELQKGLPDDDMRLIQLAAHYGLDEVTITTEDGALVGSSVPQLHLATNLELLWTNRFKPLQSSLLESSKEESFNSLAVPSENNRLYSCCKLPQASGDLRLFIGFDRESYQKQLGILGLPPVNMIAIDRQSSYVLARLDTRTILATNRRIQAILGKELPPELNFVFPQPKLLRTRFFGLKVYMKYVHVGNYAFMFITSFRQIFAPTVRALRVFALNMAWICVAVGIFLNKLRHAQELIEQQRQEEAQRRANDLATASSIQMSAMPSIFPPSPWDMTIDLFANMTPAWEVGGDFYDFYYLSPMKLVFLVADVSGKGIPAAMFMMRAKSALQSCVSSYPELSDAITEANRRLSMDNPAEMFVTCWIGVLNTSDGLLEYVNAGHNAPYLRHADGSVEPLSTISGLFLAGMDDTVYTSSTTILAPGDNLFLYTDGITEANNAQEEMYGDERLETLLRTFSPKNNAIEQCGVPSLLCTAVVDDVRAFIGQAKQFDDMTTLALLYRGLPKGESCTIRADLEEMPKISGFLERKLTECDCTPEIIQEMLIALDEIATNVISYSGSPDFTLDFAVARHPGVIHLTCTDHGKQYNPLNAPAPDLTLSDDERPIGGLGLFIVKKTMDRLYYEYQNDANMLFLMKRLNAGAQE